MTDEKKLRDAATLCGLRPVEDPMEAVICRFQKRVFVEYNQESGELVYMEQYKDSKEVRCLKRTLDQDTIGVINDME